MNQLNKSQILQCIFHLFLRQDFQFIRIGKLAGFSRRKLFLHYSVSTCTLVPIGILISEFIELTIKFIDKNIPITIETESMSEQISTFAQFWRCALQVNNHLYSGKYRGIDHGMDAQSYADSLRGHL